MGINYNDGAYPLVFLYGDSTPTATSPGSEFMRINASGNVGIGATNPTEGRLQVNGVTAAMNAGADGTLGTAIIFGHPDFPGTQHHRIRTSTSAGTTGNLFIVETSTATANVFNTNQLVLRGDGNVGIGTNSPGFKLDVNGNIYSNGDIRSQGIFRDYQGEALLQTDTSAVTLIGSAGASTSRTLAFLAGNAQRMRITSSGDIIKSTYTGFDGTYDNLIKYMANGDIGVNNNRWIGIDATVTAGGAASNAMRFRVYQGNAAQDQPPLSVMYLLGNGNVLINTTSDNGTKLNVSGTTFTQILTQSVPLHGVKVLSYGPVSSATIDLPTEFPLMLLTAGNVWGVFGKYCGFDAGGVEVREFVICRNSGGSWASANYGPQSQTNASLQSVTGSGTTITVNVDSGSYFIIELTVFVR
jgi:hypothetical protein